jgi:hypothetical protein
MNLDINSLTGKADGFFKVIFDGDDEYESTLPEMVITGLVLGERVMNYQKSIIIKNKKHNLLAEITFGYTVKNIV